MEEKVTVTIEIPKSVHADMLETIGDFSDEKRCSLEEYLAQAAMIFHADLKQRL